MIATLAGSITVFISIIVLGIVAGWVEQDMEKS